ncbi:MAG: NAD-dependent epimerase/dehydratase family protein [Candidatus Latescibacteria bacterium]|nr:NAD-dependent epimerase/dehydratase family protein [Candidatus Latescibacterota bacterium]
MSTLITGGTGFVGAQIVRLLLEQGQQNLTVFDINPNTQNLDDIIDQVTFIRGDLGNFSQVMNTVKKTRPDVIYHLGGMLSVPSDAEPSASLSANAMGTFHILEAARLFDVPQVMFSSTVATYGIDIEESEINDNTLQRPQLFYGATKVFSENMGLFFKKKYGIDFRGIRYPGVVGPGVKTPGIAQYNAWAIEHSAKGHPFTIWTKPETPHAIIYYKDAAHAMIQLANTPLENLQRTAYVLSGVSPIPTAGELADVVRQKIPTAQITFDPDPEKQKILDELARPVNDNNARKEWNWHPQYNLEHMVDDFLQELEMNPQRYA